MENLIGWYGDRLHNLTEVSLISNTDGIHTDKTIIGYVVEEPFVVLTAFITKYFVSEYNETLYPMGYCRYKYSIGIKSLGNCYHPSNFAKPTYSHLTSFESINSSIFDLASLDNNKKHISEYFDMLKTIKTNNPTIQKAIDCVDIINTAIITKDDLGPDETQESNFTKKFNKLSKYIVNDHEIMAVMRYTIILMNEIMF